MSLQQTYKVGVLITQSLFGFFYYTLRSSLQILHSAVLDDGTSRAGDLKSDSVLSRGSII